jgi:DNA polymerase-1
LVPAVSDAASQSEPRPTVVLVDAHALVYQLFHAVGQMSAPDGRPTNAVFGFARDLFYFRDELRPDYLIYVFDPPGPTFRDKIAGDYKAHRKPPDDDLIAQIPMIQQLLTAANVPVLSVPGFEADDAIATVAAAGAARGYDVLICSSDKDCRQLIGDRVRILNLRKKVFLDREALLADWGVTPEQAVDYQTLVGDSVDNVKGVRGVGDKTAAKLLQKFGSLDNLVANLDKLDGVVSPKIQAAIREAKETGALDLGRRMVRLETAVPMPLDWEAWRAREPDAATLHELFQEWGFRGFAARMRSAAAPAVKIPPAAQGDLFSTLLASEGDTAFPFGANAPADGWNGDYKAVDTPANFKAFLKDLKKQKRFAVDLETTGLDPLTADLVGIAVCWKAGEAYYLPVHGPAGDLTLDETIVIEALKPILEDPKVAKVNQNIKFDMNVFRRIGVIVRGVAGDSMVADYLLRSGERSHNLDDLAQRYFQHQNISIEELIGKGKNQKTMAEVPTARVTAYAGEDADVAWRLCERLEPDLVKDGLRTLYDDLEIPLIEVLADLEYTGIRLDVPFLQKLGAEMAGQLEGIEQEIYTLAGRKFNIASPKQLGQILFDELKLPVQKKTDLTGAASTDQETLEKLAGLGHALPKKITEYRQISKLKGTYVDALPALVNPRTGRVHTGFNQTVTSTGRLSSSEPNLQNIPARTDQGKQIRQAFLPEAGWVLLTADYSQIELRMLAHFTGDAALRQAFADDRDIHAAVAADIFGVPEAQVTGNQRRVAKTVNFGVLYGMSAGGLATRLAIPHADAARFIEQYFSKYPKVQEYQTNLLNDCRTNGYGTTILGRRRKFDKASIRPYSTYANRNQAEREAINMQIQGSAADLLKLAMLNIHRRLRRERRLARMLLTVHDELVFEVPPAELADVSNLVQAEMIGAMTLDVPLKVDVATGPNWLDVE